MSNRLLFLTGMTVLGISIARGQPAWQNPGTTTPSPDCSPFQQEYGNAPAWYCVYQGVFPWFDAGGGWTTVLRVSAPASGAIQVAYSFIEKATDGTIRAPILDFKQYGDATTTSGSRVVFALNPNQPSELTLVGRHPDGINPAEAKGSVTVTINCPDKATCAAVTPQLIYTELPAASWYLSAPISTTVSLPSQPRVLTWSTVGVNNPQGGSQTKQFMTYAIYNNSGSDRPYTLTAYDKNGAVVGVRTTENVMPDVSIAEVLDESSMPGLPAGLIKLTVSGTGPSIVTFLQFIGPAATALVPVAETPAP